MITHNSRYNFFSSIQLLSIDVVLGTLAIGYMATSMLHVSANPYWWIILPMSVWVVYSFDHIIDSYKKKTEAIIYRHKFHYLNRKIISIAVIVTSILAFVLSLLFLEIQIISLGLLLSLFIAFYFVLIFLFKQKRSIFLQKELIIAIAYTTGIFMAPLYWYGSLPSFSVIVVIFSIFALAWFEGIMISWFDYDNDIKDGHTSFSILFGKRNTRRFLILGHMVIEIITIVFLITTPLNIVFWALLITFVMNLLLGLIIIFPHSFMRNNYYRIIGETVFLLPTLVVFV